MGVALFGTALTNFLRANLRTLMPGADLNALRSMGAAGRAGVAMRLPPAVRQAVASAITHTFELGLFVLAVALVAIIVMPEIRPEIRRAAPADRSAGVGG
jgi:hypothetical protein